MHRRRPTDMDSLNPALLRTLFGAGLLKALAGAALLCTLLTSPRAVATAQDPPAPPAPARATAPEHRGQAQARGEIPCQPETAAILAAQLRSLREREAEIRRRAEELDLLQNDLTGRLRELQRLQSGLERPVKKAKKQAEARFEHLVGVYSAMDPQRAALLLGKLDEATVARIFETMKSKKVARIMTYLDPAKAARISRMLSHHGIRFDKKS
ncbi:hypothetical protein G3N55_10905 [Dissulfurirhabdus thermomarina]|uniref:Magnesium transporter MgtE intracellular domain-containing protein n=1 Tax=Dissulfurirhabdus thermomarina TaxID=1765737 RepID=A0A6N9TXZ0_DISTH|nr:hypothetical protein [Dissulfurirhabdus thermomarina]NDY43346.1 hypothetical protein [Dissulfurirhabdus thermomarina]NMX23906.1 hypothetical protein [Dissulfurirhabdus thermomarina]